MFAATDQRAGPTINTHQPEYLDVLHDFQARSGDELTLKKGSQIELIERDDEYGDGWYSGRDLVTGHIGLFPQVYTTPSTKTRESTSSTQPNSVTQPIESVEPITIGGPTYSQQPATPTESVTVHDKNVSAQTTAIFHQKSDSLSTTSINPSSVSTQSNGYSQNSSANGNTRVVASESSIEPSTPGTSGTSITTRTGYSETIPQSIEAASSQQAQNPIKESPVVQNTLSDIEEAISQITTPRASGTGHNKSVQMQHTHSRIPEQNEETYGSLAEPDDSASDYSRSAVDEDHPHQSDNSGMYNHALQGHQGHYDMHDDDRSDVSSSSNGINYTLEEVRMWTPAQVSAYLQEQDIPVPICEKFEMQEITGSILLQLEMSHLKELEINSFGKRFQVWKEIERLMDMIGLPRPDGDMPARSGSSMGMASGTEDNRGRRHRSSTTGNPTTVLPRLPSLHNRAPSKQAQMGMHRSYGERAASPVDEYNVHSSRRQSRRRSSQRQSKDQSSNQDMSSGGLQQRPVDASYDQDWSQTGPASHKITPSTATGESRFTGDSGFAGSQPSPKTSVESRNLANEEARKNVLHKKTSSSGSHTRKSSYPDGRGSTTRHSRMGSAENGSTSPLTTSSAAMAYHNPKAKKKLSTQVSTDAYLYEPPKATSPSKSKPIGKKFGNTNPADHEVSSSSPSLEKDRQQVAPQRAISDATDKTLAMSPGSIGTDGSLLTPDGSGSTPSISLAFDQSARRSHEGKDRAASQPTNKKLRSVASTSGIRQKSKKQNTSAWTEGLRETTPAEAAAQGDFSGWLKKRGSSGVVGTWKSRFFVLKGRRLSYFYSEKDTKERGLIDITSHRVLNAADDRLVSLHASVAAITSPTQPGQESSALTRGSNAPSPMNPAATPPQKEKSGWFTFKLVPPAPGAAKGVMFTPPKVHYFATDTKEVGRQWMAAMMKATIDRDETQPVVSSFTATTISLAKAKEMRTRPPAFGDDSGTDTKPGLGIDFDFTDNEGSVMTPQHDDIGHKDGYITKPMETT